MQTMREAMQGSTGGRADESHAHALLFIPDMVVVITDASFTIGDHTQSMR